jgi:hypothetical protein
MHEIKRQSFKSNPESAPFHLSGSLAIWESSPVKSPLIPALLALLLSAAGCRERQTPASTESLPWRTQSVGGLVLEAPGIFQPTAMDFGGANAVIDHAESYKLEAGGVEAQVIRILYKKDVTLSLEDSVAGSINGFAAAPNIRDLVQSQAPRMVSGHPAVRISLFARGIRSDVHLEGVTILAAPTLYQVQVYYLGGDQSKAAESKRICESVTLEELGSKK